LLIFSKLIISMAVFMRLILITITFCFCKQQVYAQKELSLCEVTVKGVRPERFMVGQKIQDVDSANLAKNSYVSLADFLQFNSPISFKSYGAGQLTSISMRGTSANHTALLRNGININFPSLGLTDFSTVPVAAFDQMTIQYGSAASCVGTDAVGGSIQLRSTFQFWQGLDTNHPKIILAKLACVFIKLYKRNGNFQEKPYSMEAFLIIILERKPLAIKKEEHIP